MWFTDLNFENQNYGIKYSLPRHGHRYARTAGFSVPIPLSPPRVCKQSKRYFRDMVTQTSVSENVYSTPRVPGRETCHHATTNKCSHTRCGVEVLGKRRSNSSSMLASRSSHQLSASSRSPLAWYNASRLSALLSAAHIFLLFDERAALPDRLWSRDGAAGAAPGAGCCRLFSAVHARRWT